jgi:hypothetical protein
MIREGQLCGSGNESYQGIALAMPPSLKSERLSPPGLAIAALGLKPRSYSTTDDMPEGMS